MVPVGTEPYRALLGLLLVWQAMITWRLQSQAVPEPGATTMRFRYPGLPLAPVVLPPSQQAAASALAQAASGLVLATGKWTASAACASLAVLVHLLLLDQSLYQNHYWLLCNVLLCFAVAADRPGTLLALLRFTHGLPYVFGALAKLTVDWLLRQEPATRWCGRMRGVSWLPDPLPACCPAAMSIGGLAIDALMVPLLLLPSRHRTWAHLLALAFHLSNALLFHIGIFPFVMLASHLLWMEPALGPRPAVDPHRPLTERRAGASDISQPTQDAQADVTSQADMSQPTQGAQQRGHSRARRRGRAARLQNGVVLGPHLHAPVEAMADGGSPKHARGRRAPSRSLADAGVAAFCACFVLFHVTWPLRRWLLYDGASLWTQEGYFGAWQMKQVSQRCSAANLLTPPCPHRYQSHGPTRPIASSPSPNPNPNPNPSPLQTQLDGLVILVYLQPGPPEGASATCLRWEDVIMPGTQLPEQRAVVLAPQIDPALTPHQRAFATRPHMLLQAYISTLTLTPTLTPSLTPSLTTT